MASLWLTWKATSTSCHLMMAVRFKTMPTDARVMKPQAPRNPGQGGHEWRERRAPGEALLPCACGTVTATADTETRCANLTPALGCLRINPRKRAQLESDPVNGRKLVMLKGRKALVPRAPPFRGAQPCPVWSAWKLGFYLCGFSHSRSAVREFPAQVVCSPGTARIAWYPSHDPNPQLSLEVLYWVVLGHSSHPISHL